MTSDPERARFDFDPADCPHALWERKFAEAREKCPVFWSEGHGGYWVAACYDTVTRIARDWENFYSGKYFDEQGQPRGGTVIPPTPAPRFPPVEMDPPEWKTYRTLLNPFFGPRTVETYRPKVERVAAALIDGVIETGRFDIVTDMANPLPALGTLEILGLDYDRQHWERWATPFHVLTYARDRPEFAQCLEDLAWVRTQLGRQLADCRAHPREGLFSQLCHAELDGSLLTDAQLVEIGMTILLGGVGTTTALFANAMMYLDQDRAARRRLIEDPSLVRLATEEFVRAYAPVHSQARTASRDIEIDGQTIRAGEQVMIALASANKDPAVFERPEEIVLDRYPNPHIGFGSGIHRCIGSFLARLFFETMLTAVLTGMPDYALIEAEAERFPAIGSVNGWIRMPARFTLGRRQVAVGSR